MGKMEFYFTISKLSEGLFRDRGSKFLSFAIPFNAIEELTPRISEIRKIHPKANHYCYAYRLQPDGTVFRANDDGEPSGTAGRPILGQLDSHKITNTLIVVVRYFGGTKLGASGLINAYRIAAKEAIASNSIIKKDLKAYYRLEFDYSKMAQVMNAVKKSQFEIDLQEFEINPFLLISVAKKEYEKAAFNLQAAIAGMIPEMFNPKEDSIGFKLNLKKVD